MARPRSEQFLEVKRAILKRAAEVFAKVGYLASTVDDLTEATGLSRGALYHYFSSKEALLFEIVHDALTGFLDTMIAAMRSAQDPVEQFRRVTAAIVDRNARARDEHAIVLNDINRFSEPNREKLKAIEREIVHRIGDLVMQLDTRGRVNPSNKSVFAMMYLGVINYTVAWYRPDGDVKPDQYAELVGTLFLNDLRD